MIDFCPCFFASSRFFRSKALISVFLQYLNHFGSGFTICLCLSIHLSCWSISPFLIIVCSLSAIIFILCISTFRTLLCKSNKRKYLDENGIDRSGGGISKNNKTNLNCELANCIDNHPISGKNRVFLLHFLSNDSDHEDVRCKLLREWIQSVVEVVDDIEDENNDEEINQDRIKRKKKNQYISKTLTFISY